MHPTRIMRAALLFAAINSIAFGAPTIVGIPTPPHDPNPLDAFEHATISDSSPATIGSYMSSHGDVFGGTDTTYPGEFGNLLFQSTPGATTFFAEFNTTAGIKLSGYSLYPLQMEPEHYRVPHSFALYARATPGPFGPSDLVSSTPIHVPFTDPPELGGYGSGAIRVSDRLATTAQYFRFEVTAPGGIHNGVRLVELDAVTSDTWVNMSEDTRWNLHGNWERGTIPNGVGASAFILAPAHRPIVIDTPIILSDLDLFPSLNTSCVLSGSGSLTLDGGSGGAGIGVSLGSHRIEVPVTINSSIGIMPTVMGSWLTIAAPVTIAGGTTISVHGSDVGSVSFASSIQANGPATIDVQSSYFHSAQDLGSNVTVTVESGGASFSSSQHLAGISASGGQVQLASGEKVIRAGYVAMGGSSFLDLADGRLIIDYAPPTLPPTEFIRSQVASGYAGGHWFGYGIHSSTAATDSRLAIGVIEASSIGSGEFLFCGETVDQTTVLAALTLKGDANLDFVVNFADLLALAQSYNATGTWRDGDSDYDGNIDFDDLLALAQNYAQPLSADQWSAMDPGFASDLRLAFAVVPEPVALWLAPGAAMVMRRRR